MGPTHLQRRQPQVSAGRGSPGLLLLPERPEQPLPQLMPGLMPSPATMGSLPAWPPETLPEGKPKRAVPLHSAYLLTEPTGTEAQVRQEWEQRSPHPHCVHLGKVRGSKACVYEAPASQPHPSRLPAPRVLGCLGLRASQKSTLKRLDLHLSTSILILRPNP